MLPAMIATLFSGIALVSFGVEGYWFYVKFVAVFFMFGFHGWLSKQRKNFIKGENKLTGKQLRIANEVPTLLLIIIVISVVIKF